jgi:hypothetical protein
MDGSASHIDLRIVKTEDNLKQALLTLLKKKEIAKITVREICELAKCSRNTFYQHYMYKEDLYDTIQQEIVDSILDSFASITDNADQLNDDTSRTFVRNIISGFNRVAPSLRIFMEKDDGTFLAKIGKMMYEKVNKGTIDVSKKELTYLQELYNSYLSYAVAGFMTKWITNPQCTAKEAEEYLYRIHKNVIDVTYAALKQMK